MAKKKQQQQEAVIEDLDLETEVPEEEGTEEIPVEPTVDLDSLGDTVSADQVARLMGARNANRPDISRLPDAMEFGRPAFKAGDKIVIERHATVLPGRPYLDTKTYRVLEVEEKTGFLRLYDESLNQFAMDNFKRGLSVGNVYKLAMGAHVATKRKRGRPRKEVTEDAKPTVAAEEPKRGRGRPKGSKNRPKEEVRAEKAAKRAASVKKGAAKRAKKGAGR